MQCVPLIQLAASSFSDDVIAQLFPAVWSWFALWGFHEWLLLRILWRSNKGVWFGIDNLYELREQNTHTTLVLIVHVSLWSLVTVNSFLFTVHLLYVRALVDTILQNVLGNYLTKYQLLKDLASINTFLVRYSLFYWLIGNFAAFQYCFQEENITSRSWKYHAVKCCM